MCIIYNIKLSYASLTPSGTQALPCPACPIRMSAMLGLGIRWPRDLSTGGRIISSSLIQIYPQIYPRLASGIGVRSEEDMPRPRRPGKPIGCHGSGRGTLQKRSKWRFPKTGVPPNHPNFNRMFPDINHPFGGTSITMETLKSNTGRNQFHVEVSGSHAPAGSSSGRPPLRISWPSPVAQPKVWGWSENVWAENWLIMG